MGKVVSEFNGVKKSLQPHGLKSKLIVATTLFVAAFGGALAVVFPVQAAEPTPTPSASVSSSPSYVPQPTVIYTPSPVVVYVTKVVKVPVPGPTTVIIKTVVVTADPPTKTTKTASPKKSVLVSTSAPKTSASPTLISEPISDEDNNSLVFLGIGVVGLIGVAFIGLGVAGIIKSRRRVGRHRSDAGPGQHDVSDYGLQNISTDTVQFEAYDSFGGAIPSSNLGGTPGSSYVQESAGYDYETPGWNDPPGEEPTMQFPRS